MPALVALGPSILAVYVFLRFRSKDSRICLKKCCLHIAREVGVEFPKPNKFFIVQFIDSFAFLVTTARCKYFGAGFVETDMYQLNYTFESEHDDGSSSYFLSSLIKKLRF